MKLPASQRQSPPRRTPRFLALLDYDGTITTRECNEVVLQELVGDAWRPFDEEVRAGRMSHIECLRRQVALIRAPRTEFLGALVAAAAPTPGLAAFLDALARRDGRAAVVSAGFREAIEAFWRREALPPLATYAGELVATGPDGGPPFALAFSESFGDCPRCGPGGCKAAVVRALRRPDDVVLVFGDGSGDVCMAREADLTFARGHLAERCAAERLEWRPLRDYTTVWDQVDEWLELRGRGSGLEPPR
jgi:HAD superfamily phosphoserine phosphatase-like hydrolase